MDLPLIPTTLVGSYVQPGWLVDREKLVGRGPTRTRSRDIWRVAGDELESAQDAATLMAIREMEAAGLDVLTDGEIRRESYSNRFQAAIGGIDVDNPAEVPGRSPGRMVKVPRIVGPLTRLHPVLVRDMAFLRANTQRPVKMTLPGPFTMAQVSVDEYYGDEEAMVMAYADIVRAEGQDLFAAGADVVQLDEPWLQARPEKARRYGLKAINHVLSGTPAETRGGEQDGGQGGRRTETGVHLCFGYAYTVKDKPSGYSFLPELEDCAADQISIEAAQPKLDLGILRGLPSKKVMVGVIDLADPAVETPNRVATRLRAALDVLPPERIIAAPDCGMKYLPPDIALGKLRAMVDGAAIVRREVAG